MARQKHALLVQAEAKTTDFLARGRRAKTATASAKLSFYKIQGGTLGKFPVRFFK
jgi:hypothetical protein